MISRWYVGLIGLAVVGCQPTTPDDKSNQAYATSEQEQKVTENLDKEFVGVIHLMRALGYDVDVKKMQANHERFAKEYNATGTIARSTPKTKEEFIEFELINDFLRQVATAIIRDNAIIYSNNGEVTQIQHHLDAASQVTISYYFIDNEPVLAKMSDNRQQKPVIEVYYLSPPPTAPKLAASSGTIDWHSFDGYDEACGHCYDKAHHFLDMANRVKQESVAEQIQSQLTNDFQSRNHNTITLKNSQQLDDYPKNSLVVGHSVDGKVGQVFYSFGDQKSQTSYGYYFDEGKLVLIEESYI